MRKITVGICIAFMLVVLIAAALASDQVSSKVLHVGFEKTKPMNNLDMYGSKPTSEIEAFASAKPVHNTSMLSRTAPKAAFNVSQRTGRVAEFAYDTEIFKPFYNVSAYSNAKPIYDAPSDLSIKPVYSIEGYPRIKAVNSIP